MKSPRNSGDYFKCIPSKFVLLCRHRAFKNVAAAMTFRGAKNYRIPFVTILAASCAEQGFSQFRNTSSQKG